MCDFKRDFKAENSGNVADLGRVDSSLATENKTDARIMLAPECYGSVIDPIG